MTKQIELSGVNKYYGAYHALRDIDLTVARGERIVICGPSGSGKSTLIRCINALEEYQEGRITVDGTVLSERVTVLDPPVRHAYVLTGFRPPFSWLVTQGEANWTFAGHEFGSRVRWDYEFTLARRWLAPVTALMLQLFMRRAMHRCLKNMARALAEPVPAAP